MIPTHRCLRCGHYCYERYCPRCYSVTSVVDRRTEQTPPNSYPESLAEGTVQTEAWRDRYARIGVTP